MKQAVNIKKGRKMINFHASIEKEQSSLRTRKKMALFYFYHKQFVKSV